MGNAALTSADAVTWINGSAGLPANAALGNIVYGSPLFVAKGIHNGLADDSKHVYVSLTGNRWYQVGIPGGDYIYFCRNLFIVPFGSGTNLLSANGGSWAAVSTGLTNPLIRVTYANGLFLGRAGQYLATSTDGTNWLQYAQPLPGGDIATDGTRLVTVGGIHTNGGTIYYNGYVYCSDVLAGIRMATTPQPKLVLSGLVGRSYRIEATDALTGSGSSTWQPLTTVQLPTTPWVWTDPTATSSPRRFYRTVLLP